METNFLKGQSCPTAHPSRLHFYFRPQEVMVAEVEPRPDVGASLGSLELLLGWMSFVGIHLPVRPVQQRQRVRVLASAYGIFCFLLDVVCMLLAYYLCSDCFALDISATVAQADQLSYINWMITTVATHGSLFSATSSHGKWDRYRTAVDRIDSVFDVTRDSRRKYRLASIVGLVLFFLLVS